MEQINPKIIQIILRQYFCNLESLVKDEDILNYYFTLIDYVNKDCDITWEEIGYDYIIWQPFEHTNPCDVIENMEALYVDIQQTLNLMTPNIVINPLELAADLANEDVEEEFNQPTYLAENGDILYTEEAQVLFNNLYEFYLVRIQDSKSWI